MARFLDTRGRSKLAIAICSRCSGKFPYDELRPDPNSPGLMCCADDLDDFDPWRMAPRPPDNITLDHPRPDVGLQDYAPTLLIGDPIGTLGNIQPQVFVRPTPQIPGARAPSLTSASALGAHGRAGGASVVAGTAAGTRGAHTWAGRASAFSSTSAIQGSRSAAGEVAASISGTSGRGSRTVSGRAAALAASSAIAVVGGRHVPGAITAVTIGEAVARGMYQHNGRATAAGLSKATLLPNAAVAAIAEAVSSAVARGKVHRSGLAVALSASTALQSPRSPAAFRAVTASAVLARGIVKRSGFARALGSSRSVARGTRRVAGRVRAGSVSGVSQSNAVTSIAMIGGQSSTQHPQDAIVAGFTKPDGTNLDGLAITSFSDGAGGAKYYLDQFNNVRAAGPGTAGTDTITLSGSATGIPSFAASFPITVHDASTFIPAGKVVFTPTTGGAVSFYSSPNNTALVVDVTTLPATGSVLGQLSVTGDASFTSPTFSAQELFGDATGFQSIAVSASGQVTTAASFGKGGGIVSMHFVATQGSAKLYGNRQLYFANSRLPATASQTSIIYTLTTSTLATAARTTIVARLQTGYYDQANMSLLDDAGGAFSLGIEDVPPYSLFVNKPLAPGSYSPKVIITTKRASTDALSATQITTVPITVLDATPTAGASISVTAPTGLKNNVRVGTVICTPTATGITGTKTWCLHQSLRTSFAIDASTGVVTTRIQLQRGTHTISLVCSDGTNNAHATISFSVAKTIGPSVTIAEGLTQVSGSTYPSLAAWLTDIIISEGAGTIKATDGPLSGAQVTLKQHSSGAWLNQMNTHQGFNTISSPWDLIGDPNSASRVRISMNTGGLKTFFDPVDADMSLTHIRFDGGHDAPSGTEGRGFFADGNSEGWYDFIDCDFSDCDHGIQSGAGLGAVFRFLRCIVRSCGDSYLTHNIYVGNNAYMEFVDSVASNPLAGGHTLKTRALTGKISGSQIVDLNNSQSSSPLDICNGGHYLIANTLLHCGPNAQNYNCLNFHPEGPFPNADVDILQTDRVTFINDCVDSGQVTSGMAVYSAIFNTPLIAIHSGAQYFGMLVTNNDVTTGSAQAPVGLEMSSTTLATRPDLTYLDPATKQPPVLPPAPWSVPAAPHTGAYGRAQSIIGGNVANVAASAADGTVIATFSLVASQQAYAQTIKQYVFGGTITAGDIVSLTATSAAVNAQFPAVAGFPITVSTGALAAGNTASTIASLLRTAINANATLTAANVKANVSGATLIIYGTVATGVTLSWSASVSGAATETATVSSAQEDIYPSITSPTWQIGTSAAIAHTSATATNSTAGGGFSAGSTVGGDISGLAITTNSDGTATLTKQGTLTTGPRKVCVMATQTGKWPKAMNITVMVDASAAPPPTTTITGITLSNNSFVV